MSYYDDESNRHEAYKLLQRSKQRNHASAPQQTGSAPSRGLFSPPPASPGGRYPDVSLRHGGLYNERNMHGGFAKNEPSGGMRGPNEVSEPHSIGAFFSAVPKDWLENTKQQTESNRKKILDLRDGRSCGAVGFVFHTFCRENP
jgi:hypothetical protein